MRSCFVGLVAATIFCCANYAHAEPSLLFVDQFEASDSSRWGQPGGATDWQVAKGVLQRTGTTDSRLTATITPQEDLLVDTRVRIVGGQRQVFGIALRDSGASYLLVRYYDHPRSLELLAFHPGGFTQLGSRSEPVELKQHQWYRLKVAAVGERVVAKLWPDGASEPNWQLDVELPRRGSGSFALVGHDDTQVEFDWVRATSEDAAIISLRAEAEKKWQALLAQLRLAAVVEPFESQGSDGPVRRLTVVPFAANDRVTVEGELTVSWGDEQIKRSVTTADYEQQGLEVELPSFTIPTDVEVSLRVGDRKDLQASLNVQPPEQLPWRTYVQKTLDTLIKHGRDDYGDIPSPLFMAVLDAHTLRSPSEPMKLGALVRLEDRLHRRGERGANPWYDQALFRTLYRMSDSTGDGRYREAADDGLKYFLENCRKDISPEHVYENGMPAWGTHVYWDCYRDRPGGDGDGNGPHEILVYRGNWEAMLRLHPAAVRHLVDGIWQFHVVDKSTGLHNRHDDANRGCDFAFSGSSFATGLATMYKETGQRRYLEQAKTVVNWHWLNRNEKTGLTADTPGLTGRYDGHHCFTTVVGPHALALLECYRLTGDEHFRNVANTYIKAYDRYGWDEQEQTYWAMLKLDGTPVPEQEKGRGYDAFAPYGHVDVWRSTIYSYEFTLAAAQAAITAYEVSVSDGRPDPELLKIARRWGQVVEQALPPKSSRRWKGELEGALPKIKETGGVYAEDYGRAISLFVHLYRATDDRHYLDLAEKLATEAVTKLYRNGLLVGHPAKPYYECTDGVGLLLEALLELETPEANTQTAW